MFEKTRKIGPNEPCPCGSGKKFKKCHRDIWSAYDSQRQPADIEALNRRLEQIRALQRQREQQQGLGRPIISTEFHGVRVVAVGSKILHSPRWRTFHDFLDDYMKTLLGSDWGNAELKKTRESRHPLLNWYHDSVVHINSHIKEPGKANAAPGTGVTAAYYGLAYDLYCLEHNAKVQGILLNRIKNHGNFYGAYYETLISGILVRAGFDIEFEDETDSRTSHCELTATFRKTRKKFSVEAKMRLANKKTFDVGNQLYEALKKDAAHTRLVFIEVNVPDNGEDQRTAEIFSCVLRSLRSREGKLTIDGCPAPSAYVVITNTPYGYSPGAPCRRSGLVEGFQMPDFKFGDKLPTLRDLLNLREKNLEVFSLMKSMQNHANVPSTFDGEIPEIAFSEEGSYGRLIIGNKYRLPDGKGGEFVGELQHATVLEIEKSVYGVYKLEDGRQQIFKCPLTNEEFAAYQRFPDTFFGAYEPHTKGIQDPIELYDYLLEIYSKTAKEILLGFLKGAPNFEQLQNLSQRELASVYAESLACGIFANARPPKDQMAELIARIAEQTNDNPSHGQNR